jgi:predicted dehydrogenase
MKTTRRHLLRRTAATTALTAAVATLRGVHAWADEESRRVRLAIVGCGAMMRTHVRGLVRRRENVSIDWLCDVDPAQIDFMAKHVDASMPCKRTGKLEDVLADDAVQACIIASPHHWHAPMALAVMKAGKDVYVEKPMSHVYAEGPLLVAAARKYGCVVQQGSQMRSSPVTAQAEKLLRDGAIGEVKVARAWTAERREEMPTLPDSVPPPGVDYDRWLGPAPTHAFNRRRFHKDWRLFRDYGNGEIGDDGIHDLDMATWGLGVDTIPRQITVRGGWMMAPNHYSEFPDNLTATFEYPDGRLILYENLPFTAYGMHGFDNGNVFYGTEGYMVFSRRGAFSVFLGQKGQPGPTESKEIRGQRGYAEHMADFLDAVRNRTPTRAGPAVAHRSCALVHLANIALVNSGRLDFDPAREQFVDNPAADEQLTKVYRRPYTLPDV